MKPYHQSDGLTIYCAVAEDVLRFLPERHFAALVVDPPYNPPEDRLGDLWGPWMRADAKALVLGAKRFRIVPSRVGWIPCEEMGTEADFGHPVSRRADILCDLLRRCPDGPVLDPFAGSGSALVAARMLGREAVGIEIERKWCQAIAERMLVPA